MNPNLKKASVEDSNKQEKKMVKDGKAFIFRESNKKSKYRKGKWLPEDYDQIDKWEIVKIEDKEENKPFLEESSFAIMFPKYRENYIKECWGIVLKNLKEIGIKVTTHFKTIFIY